MSWMDKVFRWCAPWILLGWILACLWYPLTDTDIWWHLAAAKWMWARHAFLRNDPFCLSSLGTQWTNLHWGFQLLAWATWNLGGAKALVAGKCLLIGAGIFLVLIPNGWPSSVTGTDPGAVPGKNSGFRASTASVPRASGAVPYLLLAFAVLGLYPIRFFLDVRPLAVTLCGLGLQYFALQSHLQGRLKNPWWLILTAQVIMANVQGLYPLGGVLVTTLVVGEIFSGNRRVTVLSAALGTVAVWATGFLTPYGSDGFWLPLQLFQRITPGAGNIFSSQIAENRPFLDLLRDDPRQALPFAVFCLGVLFTFESARARSIKKGRNLGHGLLFAAFLGLGLVAQRNLPLTYLAGLMAAGRNLCVTEYGTSRLHWILRSLALTTTAGLLAFWGGKIRSAWDYEIPGSLITPFRLPSGASEFMLRHPVSGNLFNDLRYGGYLDFRTFPEKPAFIDGRMILRTGDFYRDFLQAVDRPEYFPEYRRRYGFTQAMLPISEDRRFLPLAAYLLGEERWRLDFCDGASVLLSAPEAEGGPGMELDSIPQGHPLRAAMETRFSGNEKLLELARRNASDFLHSADRPRASHDILNPDFDSTP